MAETKISVVVPTRNRAKYIVQALDSVFAQTFPAAEVIVVDDGSTDRTQEVLEPHIRNKRIRYLFQEESGVSAARNKGVSLANHPFVAFLDSDDRFMPQKLEKQSQLFEQNPDLGFVHCWFSKFNNNGEELGIRDTSWFSGNVYPAMLQQWSVLMAMPCMLARTEVIQEVGGFDVQLSWAEDMDLWRRIARRYEIALVPEVLVNVRVHSSSTTFDRSGGASGFERYLEKAFEEDTSLPPIFRKRAKAKMYSKLGQNLLASGNTNQMKLVRAYEVKAIKAWPLELSAFINYFASAIPLTLRNLLAKTIRSWRYPRNKA